MHALRYRPEIDGLRALAVVPVLLFHAGFSAFSGGFVGVDVFFVISGYLITTIILREHAAGTFTYRGFYERRVRRIIPALFLVVFACMPLAWLWLMPTDMKRFATAVIAISVFGSNVLFKRTTDYFEPAAELNPLLHTWSLAVEEQYYIVFPVLLIALLRRRVRRVTAVLLCIAVASFVWAHVAASTRPAAAFFLLPARSWELLVGALLAVHLFDDERAPPALAWRQAGSLLGVVMIVAAVLVYDASTPFPGAAALLPTLGAALVIACATEGTIVAAVLRSRLFVGVGLISYSLYLWHQPLFAFARLKGQHELGLPMAAGLIALATVLAVLTRRWVEQPFRRQHGVGRVPAFTLLAVLAGVGIAAGYAGRLTGGFEGRVSEEQQAVLRFLDHPKTVSLWPGDCFLQGDEDERALATKCRNGPKGGVLVWGDSHAQALANGLARVRADVVQYTAAGCPPLLLFDGPRAAWCRGINREVLRRLPSLAPSRVVLHAHWSSEGRAPLDQSLAQTLQAIRQALPQARIDVVGGVPVWRPSLPVHLVNKGQGLVSGLAMKNDFSKAVLAADQPLQQVSAVNGAQFFSAYGSFCRDQVCRVTVDEADRVVPVAWDYGHLTVPGAERLARDLVRGWAAP